jgi:hypothetical protein
MVGLLSLLVTPSPETGAVDAGCAGWVTGAEFAVCASPALGKRINSSPAVHDLARRCARRFFAEGIPAVIVQNREGFTALSL